MSMMVKSEGTSEIKQLEPGVYTRNCNSNY